MEFGFDLAPVGGESSGSASSMGDLRPMAKPHDAIEGVPVPSAATPQQIARLSREIETALAQEAIEARQYQHLTSIDEAYYETFRAMRHVAGDDDSKPSLLSASVSNYVTLRRELLKQSLLAQHERQANTGEYARRNRLALGECGGLRDPAKACSPVEPFPSQEGVKGGYGAWRRALLGLRLEKRRHAVEDDLIRRLASEAMQRAVMAEQSERDNDTALTSASSSANAAAAAAGAGPGEAPLPFDPMTWRVKHDFTQLLGRAAASVAGGGGGGRGGGGGGGPVTITAVAFTHSAPDVFAVGTDTGLVLLCSAQTGHAWATLRGSSDVGVGGSAAAVTHLDWSEGYRETLLASCSADRSVKLWRVTFPSRKAPPSLPAELLVAPAKRSDRQSRRERGSRGTSAGPALASTGGRNVGAGGSRSVPPPSSLSRGALPTSSAGSSKVQGPSKPRARMTAEERAAALAALKSELQNDLRRARILKEQGKGVVLVGGSAECIRTIYTPWPLTHVKFVPQRPGFLVAAGVEEDEREQEQPDNSDDEGDVAGADGNGYDEEAADNANDAGDEDGGNDNNDDAGDGGDQLAALESGPSSSSSAVGGGGAGGLRAGSLRRRSSSSNSANNNPNPLASPSASRRSGRAGVLGVKAAASLITRGVKGSVNAMKAVGGATMGALEAVPVVGGAMAGTVGMTATLVKGATNLTMGAMAGAAVGTLGVLGVKVKRRNNNRRGGSRGGRGNNRTGHLMVIHASAPPDRSTVIQDLRLTGVLASAFSSAAAAAAALAQLGGAGGNMAAARRNAALASVATALTFDYVPGSGSVGSGSGGGNVLFVSDARGRVHAYQVETDPARYSYSGINGSNPQLLKDHCVVWGEGSNGHLAAAAAGGMGASGSSNCVFQPIGLSPNDPAAAGAETPYLISLSFRRQLAPAAPSSSSSSFSEAGSSPAMVVTTTLVGLDSTNHVRALKLSPPLNPNEAGAGALGADHDSTASSIVGGAAMLGGMMAGYDALRSTPGYGWAPASVAELASPPYLVYTQHHHHGSTGSGSGYDPSELPAGNHCSIAASAQNPSLFVGTPTGEVFVVDPYGQLQLNSSGSGRSHAGRGAASSSSAAAVSSSAGGLLKGGNPAAAGAGILSSQVVAKLFGAGLHPPLAAIQHVALSRFEDWLVSADELGGLFSWEKVPLSVATSEGCTAEEAGYVCEEEAWPSPSFSSSAAATAAATPSSLLKAAGALGLRGAGLGVGVISAAPMTGARAPADTGSSSTSSDAGAGLVGSGRLSRLQKAVK